jgi:hypothetical protein
MISASSAVPTGHEVEPRRARTGATPQAGSSSRNSSSHPILFAIVVSITLATSCASGPDRAKYVDANEALISELPTFPGVARVASASGAYSLEDRGIFDSPDGYGTHVTFAIPSGTRPEDMRDFYLANVPPPWRACVFQPPAVVILPNAPPGHEILLPPRLWLCSGDAFVSLDDSELTAGNYVLVADHNQGRGGKLTSPCETRPSRAAH